MSVRIYQLSKDLGMDNNELLDLLRERGFSVKSASSTVDNISADSLLEEFAERAAEAKLSESTAEAPAPSEPEIEPEAAPPPPPAAPDPSAFVRTKEQIVKEKEEAKQAAAAAAAPPPAPAPVAPAPPRAGPPPPPSPRPMAPPAGPGNLAPPMSRPPAHSAVPPASSQSHRPAATPQVNPGIRPPAAQAPASPGLRPPATSTATSSNRPPVSSNVLSSNRPPVAPPVTSGPRPPAARPPSVGSPSAPPAARPPESASAQPSSVAPPSARGGEVRPAVSGEIKHIVLKPPIVVRDFAGELGVKPFKLISELMEMGIFASINQSLEEDVAFKLAERHGFLLEVRHRGESQQPKKKKEEKKVDEAAMMEPRPPVVCVMGHVDHGKTTLLDSIRKANVVKGEAGGITQHIGAYQVEHNNHKITFLDTPGHSAFNAMRARGANVTDIAVLVVAADDGFKPQTDEALKMIQKAGVQPIVAINKIDSKGADIDKVKRQMQERGIASEDWGGEVICVAVSALNGTGVTELLDMILLQTEMHELKANPKKPGEGVIIEAQIEIGRGATATVIVQAGTLKVGDALVCGPAYTKVKALFNEHGKQVKEAPPSTPVRVIGWSDTPDCGATFETVKNEKEAKAKAEENSIELKAALAAMEDTSGLTAHEKLFAAIAATQKKTLRLIIKGDTFGSVEAIVHALKEIKSDKVAMEVISKGVGVISKSDVQKASAGGAEIIGFNVKSDNGVAAIAKNLAVKISSYQIIYELIDRVREDMVEMLDPEYRENKIGAAEVRAIFPIAKGFVAGCLVTEGRVQAGAKARVMRKGKVEADSKVVSLRRVKDEVKEVRAGTECGIQVDRYNDYKVGDTIEIFEIHEIRPAL